MKNIYLLLVFVIMGTIMSCNGKSSAQSGGGGREAPASDFKYELNRAGDGVVIREYRGTGRTVVIPAKIEEYPVVRIGNSAFYRQAVISVSIPNSVTEIGDYAFQDMENLTSIRIPNSVTRIGNSAFANNKKLTKIDLPSGITVIPFEAFLLCKSLTSVTIPDGITEIGVKAFAGCSSLKEIVIPDSVTTIGQFAFLECSELAVVKIPSHPIKYTINGDYYANAAFKDCPKLSLAVRKTIQDTGYKNDF